MIPAIKFSHRYSKIPEGIETKQTILLQVFKATKEELSKEFINYDTCFSVFMKQIMKQNLYHDYYEESSSYYPLPSGKLLVLLLLTEGKLWTTVREWTVAKEKYYRFIQGSQVQIKIVEEVSK